ncbi:gamma-glutamyl-gamma-aminobutyrate hydrolase family protein [Acidithiobacillus sp. MC6.1]|nr:gamma-glutamyl-gamma-aminobutyrate hydrolase family protein [Acidithiobacillus sp. MC6.1]
MDDSRPPVPPVIALSAYERNGEAFSLAPQYAAAVCQAGGLPILFSPQHPEAQLILSHCNALVLTGGGDISPDFYGAPCDDSIYAVHPDRDTAEIALVREAIAQGIPVFGICRGLQIINVALGGDLLQDLPKSIGTRICHRNAEYNPIMHEVIVLADTLLGRIAGRDTLEISSWHHQAIANMAPALRINAIAEDGVIEAVDMPDNPDVFAVQWHPEHTAAGDPHQQALFNWLVQRAARRIARATGHSEKKA